MRNILFGIYIILNAIVLFVVSDGNIRKTKIWAILTLLCVGFPYWILSVVLNWKMKQTYSEEELEQFHQIGYSMLFDDKE